MKKRQILNLFLTSVGISAIVASPVVLATSCSSSKKQTTSYKNVEFNVVVSSKKTKTNNSIIFNNTSAAITTPEEYKVYDPNFNENALTKVEEIKKNLTVENLQKDFDQVLQDFYEAYEFENKTTEIEVEKIEVLSKNDDGSFTLKVTYEVETETENKDKEEIKTKEINWNPSLTLIDENQINEIKTTIQNYSKKDAASGIDLSDIKEIFLGEKDADDVDDYGVFDKIAEFNKEKTTQAYLLGYEISMNDIFGKIVEGTPKARVIDVNTKFLVPSISLNTQPTIFTPNANSKLDYTLDQATLNQQLIDTTFGTLLAGQTSVEILIDDVNRGNLVQTLNSFFVNKVTVENLVNAKLQKVQIVKDAAQNLYNVFITYADSTTPDLIVIKAEQTPTTPSETTPPSSTPATPAV